MIRCRQLAALLYLLLIGVGIICAVNFASAQDEHLNKLARIGVTADYDSIKKYFNELKPSPRKLTRVRSLVDQLASDNFHQRERAMFALVAVPALPRSVLTQFKTGQDMEVEWRINQILQKSDEQKDEIFDAVLVAIARQKVKGLYSNILEAIQEFNIERHERQFHEALAATYTDTDFDEAKSGLSKAKETRKASIFVLARRSPQSLTQLFDNYIENQSEDVRLFAAKNLANIGKRDALILLVDLLDSEELSIRSKSISILRRFTKQNFGFVAYAEHKDRDGAFGKWQAWADSSGKTAKLHFPLKGLDVSFTGKFLVCNYSKNFVYSINEKGEVLWKKDGIQHPWGVQVLPNGNYIVAACTGKQLVEFTQKGKEIWKVDSIAGNPLSVQRLENGNTLVSIGSGGKIIEYGPNKKVVNEIELGGFVADAQRLENGRTLVARYRIGKIVEVDLKGKVLWELDGYDKPRSARRLPNGNTLITEYGKKRVVEVDRKGNVVFELKDLVSAYDSFRLPDGRTVVTGAQSIRMYDQKGKMEWSHAQRYNSRVFPF